MSESLEYVLIVAFGSSHICHEYAYHHSKILHRDFLGTACGLDFNRNGLLPVRRSDLDMMIYRPCKRCSARKEPDDD